MAAVEEFEIGAASQPALAPRASRPQRRGDRPGGWAALAAAAVAVGMLIAPVTLPRNLGAAPGWAGLSVVTWVIGTDETDADKPHWVCEPAAGEALCTALTDPQLTMVVDWPTS